MRKKNNGLLRSVADDGWNKQTNEEKPRLIFLNYSSRFISIYKCMHFTHTIAETTWGWWNKEKTESIEEEKEKEPEHKIK